MSLVEKINDDMKIAIKSQDKETLSVIRMLKSAIQLAAIEKKHDLTDEEVVDVLSKQIKIRKDSVVEFTKANREDLANQYNREIEILMTYMPEQLSKEKVIEIIETVINEINPTSQKQMGLIMKEVTPKVKGKADMKVVSEKIREKLSSL